MCVFHGTDFRSRWAFISSVASSAALARLALENNRKCSQESSKKILNALSAEKKPTDKGV